MTLSATVNTECYASGDRLAGGPRPRDPCSSACSMALPPVDRTRAVAPRRRPKPTLTTVVLLAPHYDSTVFFRLAVPTLVVGCQRDAVAPACAGVIPICQSIPPSVSKAFLELAGGDRQGVAPHEVDLRSLAVSAYRETCPY